MTVLKDSLSIGVAFPAARRKINRCFHYIKHVTVPIIGCTGRTG